MYHAVLAEAYQSLGDIERAEIHQSYAEEMDSYDMASLAVVRKYEACR